jgi:hypothetical protein
MHLHIIINALLGDPAGLFVVSVAEGFLTLSPIVAWVMESCEFRMFGLVQLYSPCFDVFLEQVMNTYKLDTLISEPLLQTKPGRIVGVTSLR